MRVGAGTAGLRGGSGLHPEGSGSREGFSPLGGVMLKHPEPEWVCPVRACVMPGQRGPQVSPGTTAAPGPRGHVPELGHGVPETTQPAPASQLRQRPRAMSHEPCAPGQTASYRPAVYSHQGRCPRRAPDPRLPGARVGSPPTPDGHPEMPSTCAGAQGLVWPWQTGHAPTPAGRAVAAGPGAVQKCRQ